MLGGYVAARLPEIQQLSYAGTRIALMWLSADASEKYPYFSGTTTSQLTFVHSDARLTLGFRVKAMARDHRSERTSLPANAARPNLTAESIKLNNELLEEVRQLGARLDIYRQNVNPLLERRAA